jgi:hypothetical protein
VAEETAKSPRPSSKKAPVRRRRTTAFLTKEILEMNKRGLLVSAMGDALNISDRRVKQILAGATLAAPAA